MKNYYHYSLGVVFMLTDYIIINYVFVISFFIANTFDSSLSARFYKINFLIINLIWFGGASIIKLYLGNSVYNNIWKGVFLHAVIFSLCLLFTEELYAARLFLLIFYFICCVHFFIREKVFHTLEVFFKEKLKADNGVALMGSNPTTLSLASYFQKNDIAFNYKGFLNEDDAVVRSEADYLAFFAERIKDAAKQGINEVYISLTAHITPIIADLMNEADKNCVRLKFVPDFKHAISNSFNIRYLGDFPIISLNMEPLEDVHNQLIKRVSDVLISILAIVFILSWLYPLLAIIIKIQSPGPVIFKQLRTGKNNVSFCCYKFRSMRLNGESDTKQVTKHDDRITAIGRFMRKSSLDEFPQFLNVLRGDMSIVGPRPHMLKHTEEYGSTIDKYMVRQYLKPGISGWAQVKGFRGETTNIDLMKRRVEHDIWYLKNWSLYLDLKIIFFTVFNMIKGQTNAF